MRITMGRPRGISKDEHAGGENVRGCDRPATRRCQTRGAWLVPYRQSAIHEPARPMELPMKTRSILLAITAVLVAVPALTVALPAPSPIPVPTPPQASSLTAFGSRQEIQAYLRGLAREEAALRARYQAARAGCGTPAAGQSRTGSPGGVITGRVTDLSGRPLSGASVCVRGTTARAIAGPDGAYRLVVRAGQPAGRTVTVVASSASAEPDQ